MKIIFGLHVHSYPIYFLAKVFIEQIKIYSELIFVFYFEEMVVANFEKKECGKKFENYYFKYSYLYLQ